MFLCEYQAASGTIFAPKSLPTGRGTCLFLTPKSFQMYGKFAGIGNRSSTPTQKVRIECVTLSIYSCAGNVIYCYIVPNDAVD